MGALRQDLRYAWRQLLRRPGFALAAVFTLALGMSINTLAFSAVNALFVKGPASHEASDRGWLFLTPPGATTGLATGEELERLRRGAPSSVGIAAEGRAPLAWRSEGGVETIWALAVTTNYFQLIPPALVQGRSFAASDAASPAVLVSERFWRERLGAAPVSSIRLDVDGITSGVIGVVPTGFRGPGGLFAPALWVLVDGPLREALPQGLRADGARWLQLYSNKPGQLEASDLAGQLTSALLDGTQPLPCAACIPPPPERVAFVPFSEGHPEARALRPVAGAGMALVGLVLLIAFFNVASLLLARAADREREMGIRAAIGASRRRLARQLLTEGLLLAGIAAAVALVLTRWSVRLLAQFSIPAPIPQYLDLSIDGAMLVFAAVLALLAGVLPALAPAWHIWRADLLRPLSGGHGVLGVRASRAREIMVRLQVAGSTALLAAAALVIASYIQAQSTVTGFERERVLIVEIDAGHQHDARWASRQMAAIAERVRAVPGITAAALADRVPFYVGRPRLVEAVPAGRTCPPEGCRPVQAFAAGDGFFEAMGIPIVHGRRPSTSRGAALVLGRTLARSWWGATDPTGQLVLVGPSQTPMPVAAVAGDILHRGLGEPAVDTIFLPLSEADFEAPITLVAGTIADPRDMAHALREAVGSAAPHAVIRRMQTMHERMELPMWPARTASGFFGACGVAALLLASVGLFGSLASRAARRTREFGLRKAVGASDADMRRLVMREAMWLAIPSVAAGLALAALAAQGGRALLVGVNAAHPGIYAGVGALQTAVVLLACAWPARVAARVEPSVALREG